MQLHSLLVAPSRKGCCLECSDCIVTVVTTDVNSTCGVVSSTHNLCPKTQGLFQTYTSNQGHHNTVGQKLFACGPLPTGSTRGHFSTPTWCDRVTPGSSSSLVPLVS